MKNIEERIDNLIDKIGGENYIINVNDFKNYILNIYNKKRWNNEIRIRLHKIMENIQFKQDFKEIFINHNEYNNI